MEDDDPTEEDILALLRDADESVQTNAQLHEPLEEVADTGVVEPVIPIVSGAVEPRAPPPADPPTPAATKRRLKIFKGDSVGTLGDVPPVPPPPSSSATVPPPTPPVASVSPSPVDAKLEVAGRRMIRLRGSEARTAARLSSATPAASPSSPAAAVSAATSVAAVVVPASVRADGTLRKERRVRSGYLPPDELVAAASRSVAATPTTPVAPPAPAPTTPATPIATAAVPAVPAVPAVTDADSGSVDATTAAVFNASGIKPIVFNFPAPKPEQVTSPKEESDESAVEDDDNDEDDDVDEDEEDDDGEPPLKRARPNLTFLNRTLDSVDVYNTKILPQLQGEKGAADPMRKTFDQRDEMLNSLLTTLPSEKEIMKDFETIRRREGASLIKMIARRYNLKVTIDGDDEPGAPRTRGRAAARVSTTTGKIGYSSAMNDA
eukprot:TRINITY_DN7028_c0_g1_i1.p1 TRINITY_DN7028_c0_g1~~TRINITY_DN7028_c0_g1_i1.p1  ORF type:complete len:435 (-),score=88.80 TRINITY_DN7028_c0_g1_i1:224-1528(-)